MMKKTKSILAFSLVTLLGASVLSCSPVAASSISLDPTETYVTLDINPSLGFVVNEQNQIMAVHALNEDGEMLLLQLHLANGSLDDGLETVIDTAIDLGYIDVDATSTDIKIETVGKTTVSEDSVRAMVQNKVQTMMQSRNLTANVVRKTFSTEEVTNADALGVTPQMKRIMDVAMLGDPALTQEQARTMTGEALVSKIRVMNQSIAGVAYSLKAQYATDIDAVKTQYQAQIQTIENQIVEAEDANKDTTTLTTSLSALQAQYQTALQGVLDDYAGQSTQLRTTLQTQYQTRISDNAAKVNAYKQRQGTH